MGGSGEREKKGEILYPQRAIENPDHSNLSESLGMHYHFWTSKDRTVIVSSMLHGGSSTYNSNRSKNYQISADCTSEFNRHGNIYYLECFKHNTAQFLGHIKRQN